VQPAQRDGAAISRRRFLLAAGLVAATSATAVTIAAQVPTQRRGIIAARRPEPVDPPSSPSPNQSGVAALAKPVFTLADYRKVVPGPAFASNAVALTIDDGPHPVWTPKILDLLAHHHIPATFFLIGNQVRGHASVARSVTDAGHHVANHTYTHPTTLQTFSEVDMHNEIQRAQDRIHEATGQVPTLFRSPGGGWSPPLMGQIARAGLIPIDWSDDPHDWKRPGAPAIVSTLEACRPGQILLCHDGGGNRSQTYTALQTVIPALLARGYTFVAL
jgi:peptidoglycan-N-acetylglucosamine deacetylase